MKKNYFLIVLICFAILTNNYSQVEIKRSGSEFLDCVSGGISIKDFKSVKIPNSKKYKVGVDDQYNNSYDFKNITLAGPAAYYEEVVCRLKEVQISKSLFQDSDWSYDSTNDHQGKNWK